MSQNHTPKKLITAMYPRFRPFLATPTPQTPQQAQETPIPHDLGTRNGIVFDEVSAFTPEMVENLRKRIKQDAKWREMISKYCIIYGGKAGGGMKRETKS